MKKSWLKKKENVNNFITIGPLKAPLKKCIEMI